MSFTQWFAQPARAIQRCSISTSSAALYPRKPTPKFSPVRPTSEQLAAPPTTQKFTTPHYKRTVPIHIRMGRPRPSRRFITDTDTAIPLPTTFPAGVTSRADLVRPQIPSTPLPITATNPFPYKYYEISLRRSLNGLPATVKKVASAIGLTGRHQVVWRPVSARHAGQILKLRELVAVRLVNEIPSKVESPLGFAKVGNAVGSA
ncbi:hypothetical protein PhCBS80983_g02231 [Powellomyces hirtus]|uniref:Large ribosomal subunit protein uL30-like ferredoxin-like fold domain-containing protein n=1 Tax=Powellomyces hirtus TaxID=109895 RepID=A0A507E7X8_9FUNG|nr:hypothetical protein PhCBS80983_g02231 [Powellomyces hirtus]